MGLALDSGTTTHHHFQFCIRNTNFSSFVILANTLSTSIHRTFFKLHHHTNSQNASIILHHNIMSNSSNSLSAVLTSTQIIDPICLAIPATNALPTSNKSHNFVSDNVFCFSVSHQTALHKGISSSPSQQIHSRIIN